MAQNFIMMNGVKIRQPDKGLGYNFETTYSEDTTRLITGGLHSTTLFTVEALSYQATGVTVQEMKQILGIIASGRPFTLHYFSPLHGKWRNDKFYVGQGNLAIGTLKEDSEEYDSLSFNMTGANPI